MLQVHLFPVAKAVPHSFYLFWQVAGSAAPEPGLGASLFQSPITKDQLPLQEDS